MTFIVFVFGIKLLLHNVETIYKSQIRHTHLSRHAKTSGQYKVYSRITKISMGYIENN